MKKSVGVQEKILNHLLRKGKKPVAEKVLKKSLKEIQKTSKKQTKTLVLSALILATPLLKVLTFKQKRGKKKKLREIPIIIKDPNVRVSGAIKLLTAAAREKEGWFFKNLGDEFLQTAALSSGTLKSTQAFQDYVWSKKHLVKNFRWR